MDISKVSVCAFLVLLGLLLDSHVCEAERSTGDNDSRFASSGIVSTTPSDISNTVSTLKIRLLSDDSADNRRPRPRISPSLNRRKPRPKPEPNPVPISDTTESLSNPETTTPPNASEPKPTRKPEPTTNPRQRPETSTETASPTPLMSKGKTPQDYDDTPIYETDDNYDEKEPEEEPDPEVEEEPEEEELETLDEREPEDDQMETPDEKKSVRPSSQPDDSIPSQKSPNLSATEPSKGQSKEAERKLAFNRKQKPAPIASDTEEDSEDDLKDNPTSVMPPTTKRKPSSPENNNDDDGNQEDPEDESRGKPSVKTPPIKKRKPSLAKDNNETNIQEDSEDDTSDNPTTNASSAKKSQPLSPADGNVDNTDNEDPENEPRYPSTRTPHSKNPRPSPPDEDDDKNSNVNSRNNAPTKRLRNKMPNNSLPDNESVDDTTDENREDNSSTESPKISMPRPSTRPRNTSILPPRKQNKMTTPANNTPNDKSPISGRNSNKPIPQVQSNDGSDQNLHEYEDEDEANNGQNEPPATPTKPVSNSPPNRSNKKRKPIRKPADDEGTDSTSTDELPSSNSKIPSKSSKLDPSEHDTDSHPNLNSRFGEDSDAESSPNSDSTREKNERVDPSEPRKQPASSMPNAFNPFSGFPFPHNFGSANSFASSFAEANGNAGATASSSASGSGSASASANAGAIAGANANGFEQGGSNPSWMPPWRQPFDSVIDPGFYPMHWPRFYSDSDLHPSTSKMPNYINEHRTNNIKPSDSQKSNSKPDESPYPPVPKMPSQSPYYNLHPQVPNYNPERPEPQNIQHPSVLPGYTNYQNSLNRDLPTNPNTNLNGNRNSIFFSGFDPTPPMRNGISKPRPGSDIYIPQGNPFLTGAFAGAGSFAHGGTGSGSFQTPTNYPSGGNQAGGNENAGFQGSNRAVGSSGANSFASSMVNSGDDLQRKINKHFQEIEAQNKAIQAQIERQIREQQESFGDIGNVMNSGFPGFGGFGNSDSNDFGPNIHGSSGSFNEGPASAISSINIGPSGGFQAGQISPVEPGIFSRFAEDVPAPSGDNVAVFSSSSSSQSVGPDGKVVSRKSVTTGINDNGKISVKTIHDP